MCSRRKHVSSISRSIVSTRPSKPEEALAVAERSLTFHERVFSPDDPEIATALHTLGFVLYDYRLDFARAETLHRRALALREKALGPTHPRVVDSLIRLSNLYRAKGDYATAIPLRERALEIEERTLGTNNPAITDSIRSLAVLYSRKGDDPKTEALFERVLAIRESALGPDHEDVGLSLRDLSTAYSDRGDYERAESFQRRALAIFEKSKNAVNVASSLNSLGVIYGRKGDDVTAEQFFQQSLAMEVASSGAESTNTAFYTFNLGNFYAGTNDRAKAHAVPAARAGNLGETIRPGLPESRPGPLEYGDCLTLKRAIWTKHSPNSNVP